MDINTSSPGKRSSNSKLTQLGNMLTQTPNLKDKKSSKFYGTPSQSLTVKRGEMREAFDAPRIMNGGAAQVGLT